MPTISELRYEYTPKTKKGSTNDLNHKEYTHSICLFTPIACVFDGFSLSKTFTSDENHDTVFM